MTVGELLAAGARCDRSGSQWRAALEFHAANPWVYERLRSMCADLLERGFTRYSSRTLVAVLRFDWDLRTGGQVVRMEGGERIVKLNDHSTAYYARMLIEAEPALARFFELRAAEGDPTSVPPPAPVVPVGTQLDLL